MKTQKEIENRLNTLLAVEGILSPDTRKYIQALKWVLE